MGKKDLTIERLTNEANFLVDDCLFLLSKDKGRMATYVEKLKKLLDEVKADMPNPPSRNTGDVIGGICSISKPNQVDVKNPTKAVNKGEHLKKRECLKSEREKAIKVRAKKIKEATIYRGVCVSFLIGVVSVPKQTNPVKSNEKKDMVILSVAAESAVIGPGGGGGCCGGECGGGCGGGGCGGGCGGGGCGD
ncbi:hypothetical protein Tco_1371450 [Tanacetum coccineum]